MDSCKQDSCNVRLGNFLLPTKYGTTISNIFKVYEELKDYFIINKISVSFYERGLGKTESESKYKKLASFQEYQDSFRLPKESSLSKDWPTVMTPRAPVLSARGGGKKQKSKKQKTKSKKQKAKNQKTKKYKKLKLL